jgi:hypothetical protein
MAHSALFTEIIAPVPEDGFDDSEFTDYLEGNGKRDRAWSSPAEFARRISGIVEEALSRCQSIVGKSSRVLNILTGDLKDDTLAMDYIETMCSESLKIDTEYNAIRNIVTGGMADAWYPNSSPGTEMPPPLPLPVPSPPSLLGVALWALVPVPIPATACGAATNHMIARSVDCNAAATQGGNIDIEAAEPGKEENNLTEETAPKTTLMLRNLPMGLTRNEVMDVLRSEGFADHVKFIYLPLNLRAPGNFGYAFVDFDTMASAEQCKDHLEGFSGWSAADEKVLEIAWSETQGIDTLIQRYRNSPIMHPSLEDAAKPALFKNGVRIAFPPPTQHIRAPRLRKTDRSSQ